MDKQRKPCIFCGEVRKRSNEHIWPEWISKLFPGDGDFHYVRFNKDGSEDVQWKAPKFNHTIRSVCKTCNEGWMATLERLIKPLIEPAIRGSRVFYEPVHQEAIAVWAAKMAMVFDYAHEEPRHAFTQGERKTLAKTGRPPFGFVVWLAAYKGDSIVWYRSHDLSLRRPDEPESPGTPHVNGHSSTFVVGRLVFRVWKIPDLQGGLEIGWNVQSFIQMIWPQGDLVRFVVRWPPDLALDDDGLRSFSEYLYS